MIVSIVRVAALAAAVTLSACAHRPPPPAPGGLHFASRVAPGPGYNWPVSPKRAERLFARGPIQFLEAKPTDTGVAGAFKADVEFPPDPREVEVKWKPVSAGDMDNWNNNPRKEIAAYAMQKWFLEPRDYVVPTTALRCVPLNAYQRVDPKARPQIEGTTCVLGMLALWLEHVKVPEPLLDRERFARDYAYAYHMSDFNVLTYLIRHRDGRAGNILVADDDTNRRVFAVDNGISFDGLVYNFLVDNWDTIRVPAVRREVIDELRDVDREDLEHLGTLVELRADKTGVLRAVRSTSPIDPTKGVRVQGGRVQMGLTQSEIDGVATRIRDLIRMVDSGELATF
jgi:hypothetical protein